MESSISCMKCKNFYVTWDSYAPRGCRVYGFKGKQIPSTTVRIETGKECTAFSPKQSKPKSDELDLNDPKNW